MAAGQQDERTNETSVRRVAKPNSIVAKARCGPLQALIGGLLHKMPLAPELACQSGLCAAAGEFCRGVRYSALQAVFIRPLCIVPSAACTGPSAVLLPVGHTIWHEAYGAVAPSGHQCVFSASASSASRRAGCGGGPAPGLCSFCMLFWVGAPLRKVPPPPTPPPAAKPRLRFLAMLLRFL